MEFKLSEYGTGLSILETKDEVSVTINGFNNKLSNVTEVTNIIANNVKLTKIKSFSVKKGLYKIKLIK